MGVYIRYLKKIGVRAGVRMKTVSMYRGKEITSTKEKTNEVSIIPLNSLGCTNYVSAASTYRSQKRLKCAYCDCINDKDYGTCDYCGAPLRN